MLTIEIPKSNRRKSEEDELASFILSEIKKKGECVYFHYRTEMKKILIICVLFALIAGCASPRNSVENHPAKNSPQPDALPDNKENRFTKQFQQADSMFNQKYRLNE